METGDKHNVVVLVTWWGLNPLALIQAESWRGAYEHLQARGEQLHVFVPEDDGASVDDAADQLEQAGGDPDQPVLSYTG